MTRRTYVSTAFMTYFWILLIALAAAWLPAGAQRLAVDPGFASAVVQTNPLHHPPSTADYTGPASGYVPLRPLAGGSDSYGNIYFFDYGVIHVIASGKGPIPGLSNPSQPNYVASPVANNVYQVAGNGKHGGIASPSCTGTDSLGDGCYATQAWINDCGQGDLSVDSQGNVFLADTCDNVIRAVYAKGTVPNLPSSPVVGKIYAVAGNGSVGTTGGGGPALNAEFSSAVALTVDGSENIYIADNVAQTIDVVYSGQGSIPGLPENPQAGYLYTIVGVSGSACKNGGTIGSDDCGDNGPANQAQLNEPAGIHLDPSGNIYIGDSGDNRLRAVYVGGSLPGVSSPLAGNIYTVAGGSSTAGFSAASEGGPATQASVRPKAVTIDAAGNIYFAETDTNTILRVDSNGIITLAMGNLLANFNQATVCGGATDTLGDGCPANNVLFSSLAGIFGDPAGNLYGFDTGNVAIHKSDLSTTSQLFTESVGFTANQTTYLYNTDTQPLQLSGLSFPSFFAQTPTGSSDCSSSTVLNPGSSCVIDIGYTASTAGTNTGTLKVASNSTNATGGNNAIALSGTATQDTTTTALAISTALANVGQPITLTATVSAQFGSTVAPTGAVAFMNGTATIGTAQVGSNGVATFTTSSLTAGAYSLYASYAGDTNCQPSASYIHALTVSSTPVPVVTLTTSASTLAQGAALTLSATVTPYSGSAVPTGTVTFQDGSVVLGTATLNGGNASFSISSLPVGANTLYASYGGDSKFAAALSTGVAVQVTAGAPQAQLVPGTITTFSNTLFAGIIVADTSGNLYYTTSNGAYVIASGKGKIAGVSNPVAGTTYTVVLSACSNFIYPCNVPGPAANAGVGGIYDLKVDAASNVYLLANSNEIFRIDAQTDVITNVTPSPTPVVGSASASSPALSSALTSIFLDNSGNMYISDYNNSDILRVDAMTGVMTLVAGTPGTYCPSTTAACGDGGPASSASLFGGDAMYVDAAGNLYLTDQDAIRKIDGKTGIINTIAGIYGIQCILANVSTTCGDGGPASQAYFSLPTWITGDAGGNLYIVDYVDSAVRRIDTQGNIATIAGIMLQGADGQNNVGDNGPATSAPLYQPVQISFDPQGKMYIATNDFAGGLIREVTAATSTFTYTAANAGPTGAQAVRVTNTTDVPLHITGLTFSSGFVQQPAGTDDCIGADTLAPGGFCNFEVAYYPTTKGPVTGSVNIADDSSNATSGMNVISLSGTSATGSQSNVITFGSLPNVTYGAVASITLGATASSGEAVTYAVTGPATVSGSTLTITGAGKVTVTAYQFGDSTYEPAKAVPQSFTVAPAALTVTANSFSCQGGQVASCLASNPLAYTITGFVNGDTNAVVSGTATLTTTVTASSPAGSYPITFQTENLSAASYTFTYVPGTVTITGGELQTITFGTLQNVNYGVNAITLNATASSGLPVSYSVTGPAMVSGPVLSVTGAGVVTVTAQQLGNDTFAAAAPVSQTFTVNKAALAVTANNLTMAQGNALPDYTYSVTGLVNNDPSTVVSGSPSFATTAGSTSPVGNYPIIITQGTLAAVNYSFTFVNGTLSIVAGTTQTITFTPLPNLTYGAGPLALTATASSGLPITYSVTGPATISGSYLLVNGTGPVTVTATQAGQGNYSAATPVTQSLTVAPAVLTIQINNVTRMDDTQNPPFTWTLAGGLVNGDTAGVIQGTTSFSTVATPSSPAGTYPITANLAGGGLNAANYTFTYLPGTLTVTSGGPTPDFVLTASPNTLTMLPGQAQQTTLTLTPTNYFNGTVQASCGKLPANMSCVFTPAAFNADGSDIPVSITLTINTNGSSPVVGALTHNHGDIATAAIFWLPGGITGLLIAFNRRRLSKHTHLRQGMLLFVLLSCLTGGITACGGKSSSSGSSQDVVPGTTTVTVTGAGTSTNSSGAASHTVNLTVTVEGVQ